MTTVENESRGGGGAIWAILLFAMFVAAGIGLSIVAANQHPELSLVEAVGYGFGGVAALIGGLFAAVIGVIVGLFGAAIGIVAAGGAAAMTLFIVGSPIIAIILMVILMRRRSECPDPGAHE